MNSQASPTLLIKNIDVNRFLRLNEIVYLKASNSYTEIHTISGKFTSSKPLKHYQFLLEEFGFVRIHKSYIVNMEKVLDQKKIEYQCLSLINQFEVPISQKYKVNLREWLKSHGIE